MLNASMFLISVYEFTLTYHQNKRERARNATLIIGMEGQTTTIFDPEQPDDVRKFTFDYSYWSHDGSKELEDGYFAPEGPGSRYIGQVCKHTDFFTFCISSVLVFDLGKLVLHVFIRKKVCKKMRLKIAKILRKSQGSVSKVKFFAC